MVRGVFRGLLVFLHVFYHVFVFDSMVFCLGARQQALLLREDLPVAMTTSVQPGEGLQRMQRCKNNNSFPVTRNSININSEKGNSHSHKVRSSRKPDGIP